MSSRNPSLRTTNESRDGEAAHSRPGRVTGGGRTTRQSVLGRGPSESGVSLRASVGRRQSEALSSRTTLPAARRDTEAVPSRPSSSVTNCRPPISTQKGGSTAMVKSSRKRKSTGDLIKEDSQSKAVLSCPICFEEMFRTSQAKSVTICGHVFCTSCIIKWLSTSAQTSCPICFKRIKKTNLNHVRL